MEFRHSVRVSKKSMSPLHPLLLACDLLSPVCAQRSSELNKSVVGTEDLLWAMFQQEEHFHSRYARVLLCC